LRFGNATWAAMNDTPGHAIQQLRHKVFDTRIAALESDAGDRLAAAPAKLGRALRRAIFAFVGQRSAGESDGYFH
jgi:hypothetical protein